MNVLGATGNFCDTVTFDSNTPSLRSFNTPNNFDLGQNWAIGDVINLNYNPGSNNGTEFARLVMNTGGTTWVIQRAYGLNSMGTGFAVQVNSGTTVAAWCQAQDFLLWNYGGIFSYTFWWDYINDPHATNANDPHGQGGSVVFNSTVFGEYTFSNGSHIDIHSRGSNGLFLSDGGCTQTGSVPCNPPSPFIDLYGIRDAAWPGHPRATSLIYFTAGNVAFSGAYGLCFGDTCEKHSSKVVCDNSTLNYCDDFFVDDRTLNLGSGNGGTIAAVGGTVNVFDISGLDPVSTPDPKRHRIGVNPGNHVLKDISGPGSCMASPGGPYCIQDGSSGYYTICWALATNECFSGGVAGHFYVNIPLPSAYPTGSGMPGSYACIGKSVSWRAQDYPCIYELASDSDFVMTYGLTGATDYYGLQNRRITKGLIPPGGSNLLGNARNLPDGSYMMLFKDLVQNRGEVLLAKLPPWPGASSVNRTDFLPIALTRGSVPAGTDNVIVRFGYNPSFNCTRRQEACIANSATLQSGSSVLSFEGTDSYNGLSCSLGCIVTIPALSQRVMWYQWVFRNGSNNIIGTAPIEVLATP
jgi:hypothetical protein